MSEEFKMDELYHHGIKGQRWGIRRTPAQLGYKASSSSSSSKTIDRISRINAGADDKIKKIKAKSKDQAKISKAQAKANARIEKANLKAQAKIEKASNLSSKKSFFKTKDKTDSKSKSIKDMSDEEIANKINRIRLENTLKSLTPEKTSKGKAFIQSTINDVISPAARESGRRVLTAWLSEQGGKMAGLNKEDGISSLQKKVQKKRLEKELESYTKKDPLEELQERNARARLEKEYKDMTDPDPNPMKDLQTYIRNMNTIMNYNSTSERFREFIRQNSQNTSYNEFMDSNDDVIYQGQRHVAGLLEDERR